MHKKHESMNKPKKAHSHADARSAAKSGKSSHGMVHRQTKSESNVSVKKTRKRLDSFSHIIYENASKIFQHLKGQITSSMLPVFEDDLERRRAYSLAFGAKRYEKVLDDILLDSYFFSSYFKFETYHKHQVMVLLIDYQQNGFFFGNEKKKTSAAVNEAEIIPDIQEIQEALISHRTKLRAALARSRIKDCAISVEALLPREEQEKIQYAAAQPVYTRINTLKTTSDDVLEALKRDGFSLQAKLPEEEEIMQSKCFCRDEHFENLLVFPHEAKFDLHGHALVQDGHLVIQDKSTIISVEVVRTFVNELALQKEKVNILIPGADIKNVMGEGDDIIQTHVESGNITAYLSSVIHPDRRVFTFGVTPESYERLESTMLQMGANNVDLLEEHFLDVLPNDERFKKVKIIVVNVPSSKSGIVNPVDFILQEGVSASIKDLAQGTLDNSKIRGLAFQHLGILKHAMKFPYLQGIVYMTRSVHELENYDVVKKALDETREESAKQGSFEVIQALPNLANRLKEVARPSYDPSDEQPMYKADEKFIRIEPSSFMNGGFVVLLKKQKVVESPHDVLERAAKKGLMKPAKSKTPRAQSGKTKRVEQAHVKPRPTPSLPMAKLSVAEKPSVVISDSELDTDVKNPPRKSSTSKTKSWHGSDENVSERRDKDVKGKRSHERKFKF